MRVVGIVRCLFVRDGLYRPFQCRRNVQRLQVQGSYHILLSVNLPSCVAKIVHDVDVEGGFVFQMSFEIKAYLMPQIL